jgi:hypothetical protein
VAPNDEPGQDMPPEQLVQLTAEERRRMERETDRLRQEDDDISRRIEHVRARVRVVLGLPDGGGSEDVCH